MSDLTVLFLTENRLPPRWKRFQKETLLRAVGNYDLITISRKPLKNMGTNLIQKRPRSRSNIYRQMLRAAKVAKTEFFALAEDDALYSKEHFQFRPRKNVFAYNNNHWSLFTWGEPIFHWTDRRGNYSLITRTELVIEGLGKVFGKYPNGIPEHKTGELGRSKTTIQQGVKQKIGKKFYSGVPIVIFHHKKGFDRLARKGNKAPGPLQALEIPYWGRARDLVKKFR
jgi:hypothetical protein